MADFPAESKRCQVYQVPRHRKMDVALKLVLTYQNVYVDFAVMATDDKYYESLGKLLGGLCPSDREKLTSRILFGSDFPIVLVGKGIDSYNQYLTLFAKTPHLSPAEKHLFCSVNPARFLFGSEA